MSKKVSVSSALDRLKKEKYWLCRASGSKVHLSRMMSGKAINLLLTKNSRGKFNIQFPAYLFTSKISHFGPSQDEYRFCRNKALLFSLMGALKRSAVWNLIDNKDFIVVNNDNPRSDKRSLKKKLRTVTEVK